MFVRVESVQTKVKWLVTLKKLVVTRAKRLAGLAGHRLTWQHLTLSSLPHMRTGASQKCCSSLWSVSCLHPSAVLRFLLLNSC